MKTILYFKPPRGVKPNVIVHVSIQPSLHKISKYCPSNFEV